MTELKLLEKISYCDGWIKHYRIINWYNLNNNRLFRRYAVQRAAYVKRLATLRAEG